MCLFKKRKESPDPELVKECLAIITTGRYNHQYYIDHPNLQDSKTGDTEFNKLWVNNYDKLKSLIEELTR